MSIHAPIDRPQKRVEAARNTKRTRVLMAATLTTPAGAQRVTIRDISRSGAQVATATRVESECDAIFKRGSLFVAARVAWANNDEAGIRFYRELAPEEMDGTLPLSVLGSP